MNVCQMNNNTNSSAPSSPAGTAIAANTSGNNKTEAADQQATDSEQSKLARSRSLSDISQSGSPSEDLQHAPEGLKVRIKTNNIISKKDSIETNDSNNNTNDNISSNNKSKSESINNNSNKKANNNSNRTGNRKSKQNNGDNSGVTSNSINTSTLSNNSSTSETTMNDKRPIFSRVTGTSPDTESSPAGGPPAENGKKSDQSQQPTHPPEPKVQPAPQTQQSATLQPQSQQPPVPTPTPPHSQVSSQPTPELVTTRLSSVTPTTVEPKPKTTRARKQTGANNKNANTTNAIAKPEPKRKTKAKQNAEAKAAASVSASLTSTQQPEPISPAVTATAAPSFVSDKKVTENQRQAVSAPAAKKRKPRTAPITETTAQPTNPPKRTRKKKDDRPATANNSNPPSLSTSVALPLNVANPQLLTVASMPMGLSPSMNNMHPLQPPPMQPLNIKSNMHGMSPHDMYEPNNRLYLTMPYPTNSEPTNTSSLTRPSLTRLFTSSAAEQTAHTSSHPEEIAKAFDELRDNVWSQVSRSVIELAQHFDIPSLIGTLYTLRQENDKLVNKVRDLTTKRDQLIAMNARLDLPGPMLTQHLSHTSPNFSSVVASLTNSPKSLANSSPSPAMNKSPLVSGSSYNHVPPGSSLGPPGYERSSPLVGMQTQHSGVNSLKSSTIPLPSPPTGALMAHGANNRASLMTVNNSPFMTNIHPSMNTLNQLSGPNTPSSSYYTRQ